MNIRSFLAVTLLSLSAWATSANAQVFVGSWTVDQGPSWSGSPPNGPLAYSGQEAAALVFGGNASDYYISTIDNNPLNINHMAWYDVIGVGENLFAENYFNKYLGQYYGPTSGYNCCGQDFANINAASAYVSDNTSGLTNYAFRVTAVPEPETYAMMLAGLGLLGFAARRRKAKAAV